MSDNQVSKEQIAKAKEMDLLTYLQTYEPSELVKVSGNIFSTREHDSLKLSNGKWMWWSKGIGGRSALDFLVKVRGMSFVEAVQQLCDCLRFEQPVKVYTPKPIKKFIRPKPFKNNDRVIDYLMRRGIGIALLKFCINTGRLYEDERHNCCFVGFDTENKPRYAMLRSSDPSSAFLREVEGSDKAYSFSLPPQKRSQTLYLFESAIDCLSFAELQRMDNADWKPDNYLSLSGVYQPRKELPETPLPIALAFFLHENIQLERINLCFDNDHAGEQAAQMIIAFLGKKYEVKYIPPEHGKDYNEQLMKQKGLHGITVRGAKSVSFKFKEEMER